MINIPGKEFILNRERYLVNLLNKRNDNLKAKMEAKSDYFDIEVKNKIKGIGGRFVYR